MRTAFTFIWEVFRMIEVSLHGEVSTARSIPRAWRLMEGLDSCKVWSVLKLQRVEA
jgi:hypothetical protein